MQRKPRGFLGGLMWTVVILAVGYGGFVAYERWWGTPEFKAQVVKVEQKAGEVLGTATEWVADLVKQSAKEKAGEVIISASDSLSAYGEQMKGTKSGSGSGSSATLSSTNVGSVSSTLDIGISVLVGAPLSFFLPPATFYVADWGDGKKEEKSISTKTATTITHKWSTVGRFGVVIETRNGEFISKESFMVNVTSK